MKETPRNTDSQMPLIVFSQNTGVDKRSDGLVERGALLLGGRHGTIVWFCVHPLPIGSLFALLSELFKKTSFLHQCASGSYILSAGMVSAD